MFGASLDDTSLAGETILDLSSSLLDSSSLLGRSSAAAGEPTIALRGGTPDLKIKERWRLPDKAKWAGNLKKEIQLQSKE